MSEQELENITNWASLLFSPRDICTLEELPWSEYELRFMDDEDPVSKAFKKGVLLTEAERRKKIIKLAKDGSPAAQILLNKFSDDQKRNL